MRGVGCAISFLRHCAAQDKPGWASAQVLATFLVGYLGWASSATLAGSCAEQHDLGGLCSLKLFFAAENANSEDTNI